MWSEQNVSILASWVPVAFGLVNYILNGEVKCEPPLTAIMQKAYVIYGEVQKYKK